MTTSTAPSTPHASTPHASTPRTSTPQTQPVRVPLRLELRALPREDQPAGAWWPQSRDLLVGAADLVDHFPAAAGRIARILHSQLDWEAPHRRVTAERGTVKAGYFPRDDTRSVVLTLSDHRRIQSTVVPPQADEATARAQMSVGS